MFVEYQPFPKILLRNRKLEDTTLALKVSQYIDEKLIITRMRVWTPKAMRSQRGGRENDNI